MEREQKIRRAKIIVEMLACSMDPTTQQYVEDSVLGKAEVKETLEYVVELLEEILAGKDEKESKSQRSSFQVSQVDTTAIEMSDEPIKIFEFARNVNKIVNRRKMRGLAAVRISNWLKEQGYLSVETIEVVKSVKQWRATEKASQIGIIMTQSVDEETGEITSDLMLTRQAQEYLVENLGLIAKRRTAAPREGMIKFGAAWTQEEEETLKDEYVNQKLSVSAIAALHGRNDGGIRARLKKIGLL